MISKKTFAILLVLVAFIASIYAPLKILPIKIPIYYYSSSPYNTLWNGTSEFYNMLKEEGYEVYLLNSMSDINRLVKVNDSFLYIVIAPDRPFTLDDIKLLKEAIQRAYHASFLIADENITSNSLLMTLFHAMISGLVIKDPNSPYGPLFPVVKCKINDTEYTLVLNIASYITLIPRHPGFEEEFFRFLCTYEGKPIVVYYMGEDYEGIIISDSSIFINQFFKEEYLNESVPKRFTSIENKQFAIDIVKVLTHGDKEYKIIIDCLHYKALGIETLLGLPIPPIGLIISMFLTMMVKALDSMYLSLLSQLPLIMKFIALLLILFLAYIILKKLGGKHGFDEGIYRRIETSILLETELPSRRMYNVRYLTKKDIIETLASLYEILRKIALKELNLDFMKIDEENVLKRFRLIFKEKSDRALRAIRKLRKIYEYHIGKRKFIWPPIIFWRRTLSKLVLDSEMILETMGATIMGKPGVKGVEYRLRKI